MKTRLFLLFSDVIPSKKHIIRQLVVVILPEGGFDTAISHPGVNGLYEIRSQDRVCV